MSLSYIGCNQLIDWLASVLPKKVRWVGGRIQIVRTFCKKREKFMLSVGYLKYSVK